MEDICGCFFPKESVGIGWTRTEPVPRKVLIGNYSVKNGWMKIENSFTKTVPFGPQAHLSPTECQGCSLVKIVTMFTKLVNTGLTN